MYEDLIKINILLQAFNERKKILINKEENLIGYNGKNKNIPQKEVIEFVEKIFELIRNETNSKKEKFIEENNGYILKIQIVEKNDKYNYEFKGDSADYLCLIKDAIDMLEF